MTPFLIALEIMKEFVSVLSMYVQERMALLIRNMWIKEYFQIIF